MDWVKWMTRTKPLHLSWYYIDQIKNDVEVLKFQALLILFYMNTYNFDHNLNIYSPLNLIWSMEGRVRIG